MYRYKHVFGALALLLCTTGGCVEQIDLPGTSLGGPKIVVQGKLVTGDTVYVQVRVDRAADFAIRSLPEPITGAQVVISSGDSQQLELFESKPGHYGLGSDQLTLPLNYGAQYRISVDLMDGTHYQSNWETLLPAPQPDSVSIEIINREFLNRDNQRESSDFVRFSVHTSLELGAIEKSFLKWNLKSIYRLDETAPVGSIPGPGPSTCFITRGISLDEVLVFNGNESNDDRLSGFFIAEEEVDSRFSLGFLLIVTQESLNEGAFNYWDQVSNTVGLSGGLFEPSPGKIRGNIINLDDPQEDVFGYFYVTEQKMVRRFVDPEVVGRPQVFCAPNSFNSGSEACSNCLSIPFSTRVIPEGWEQ